MPLHSFEHDGFTFDVDDSGDGEVVVLLHGFPQHRGCWRDVTPPLVDAGYRVLAPDQRGYSRAARPTRRRDYALPRLVGDLLALADTAGAARFHVVGHDWGGAVAWAVAMRHADRVTSMTSLATPHPRAMVRSFATSTQLLRSWYMAAFQLPALPERAWSTDRGAESLVKALTQSGLPEGDAREYLAILRGGAARGALNWYRAMPFSPPLLDPVTVPTLYVYGAADTALGRRAADLTGRYVTGPYRYEVWEDASHWLPETRGAGVAAVVLEHLEACAAR